MIAISKEGRRLVLTTHGALDDENVDAMLEAIEQSDENAPLVIDLANAGELNAGDDIRLLSALAFRSGSVRFRHAHSNHRRLVSAAQSA